MTTKEWKEILPLWHAVHDRAGLDQCLMGCVSQHVVQAGRPVLLLKEGWARLPA
jgi:hypothetical protein